MSEIGDLVQRARDEAGYGLTIPMEWMCSKSEAAIDAHFAKRLRRALRKLGEPEDGTIEDFHAAIARLRQSGLS